MSTTVPRVSVVLLAWQQRAFIEEAIASVLEQTYPNVELIIVDNGSTDGTPGLLRSEYADRPNVLLLLDYTNSSITKPLNDAIRASSGLYISLLYADDLYLPDKLARQVRAFADLPADYGVVHGPGIAVNIDTGERWVQRSFEGSGYVLPSLLSECPAHVHPISPLIRRDCFETHPFREELFVEGESIFLRFAITHKFHYLSEPLVVMREHRQNMGKAVLRNTMTGLDGMDLLERDPLFPADLRPLLDRARGSALRTLGWWAVRIAEDPHLARESLARAATLDPSRRFHPRMIASLLLSLLPRPALRAANRILNGLRRRREHLDYLPDYIAPKRP